MIGNAEEAEFIHYWYHAKWDQFSETAPEGWEYLGEGCYRTAYLSPTGVVYKVQQSESGGWQTNAGEWEVWKRLYFGCKMPVHSRLPKMYYHALAGRENLGVMASERFNKSLGDYPAYARQDETDYWSVLDSVRKATGVSDLYSTNLMIDEENKLLVPIDLGGGCSDAWS